MIVRLPAVGTDDKLRHVHCDLPDGRQVVLFVNLETSLIVLDVIDADEAGGVELYRREVKP